MQIYLRKEGEQYYNKDIIFSSFNPVTGFGTN